MEWQQGNRPALAVLFGHGCCHAAQARWIDWGVKVLLVVLGRRRLDRSRSRCLPRTTNRTRWILGSLPSRMCVSSCHLHVAPSLSPHISRVLLHLSHLAHLPPASRAWSGAAGPPALARPASPPQGRPGRGYAEHHGGLGAGRAKSAPVSVGAPRDLSPNWPRLANPIPRRFVSARGLAIAARAGAGKPTVPVRDRPLVLCARCPHSRPFSGWTGGR